MASYEEHSKDERRWIHLLFLLSAALWGWVSGGMLYYKPCFFPLWQAAESKQSRSCILGIVPSSTTKAWLGCLSIHNVMTDKAPIQM